MSREPKPVVMGNLVTYDRGCFDYMHIIETILNTDFDVPRRFGGVSLDVQSYTIGKPIGEHQVGYGFMVSYEANAAEMKLDIKRFYGEWVVHVWHRGLSKAKKPGRCSYQYYPANATRDRSLVATNEHYQLPDYPPQGMPGRVWTQN